jgi:radical SAM protein with 4Fe4S-binding SPASM domain
MQIYWLLTEACNLNCGYCIRGKKNSLFIKLEDYVYCFQKNNFTDDQILLTGGEPMLHPQFIEILKFTLNRAKCVAVNTNGTINKFDKLPYDQRLHIQISLDGTKDVHDMIRSAGSFEQTWNNIKIVDNQGINYNISTVVNATNFAFLGDLIPYLHSLTNMQYWKVEPQLPFGCGKTEQCIGRQQWNELVDYLIENSPFKLKIKKLFDFSLIKNISEDMLQDYGKRCLHNCGTCKKKVYIYPDLSVYPCTCLKNYKLGNLGNADLITILEGDQAKKFSKYEVLPESACVKCKYLPICNGGCIGMSQYFFGKLGMGDMRCPLIIKT